MFGSPSITLGTGQTWLSSVLSASRPEYSFFFMTVFSGRVIYIGRSRSRSTQLAYVLIGLRGVLKKAPLRLVSVLLVDMGVRVAVSYSEIEHNDMVSSAKLIIAVPQ